MWANVAPDAVAASSLSSLRVGGNFLDFLFFAVAMGAAAGGGTKTGGGY